MYAKQSIAQQFWTRFGQYMRPVPGEDGTMVNWLNYKTGIRHLYFRMDVKDNEASIAIELRHPDQVDRAHYYKQLVALKSILHDVLGEKWTWEENIPDEDGNLISRIGNVLKDVNLYSMDSWPGIISFFKPRILALDVFWNNAKDMVA
jgi:hypothetical protein